MKLLIFEIRNYISTSHDPFSTRENLIVDIVLKLVKVSVNQFCLSKCNFYV